MEGERRIWADANEMAWTATCPCGFSTPKMTQDGCLQQLEAHQETCTKWQKARKAAEKRALESKKAYDRYQAAYKLEGLVKEMGTNEVVRILSKLVHGKKTVDQFYNEYNETRGY